jgi:hypothetical protein
MVEQDAPKLRYQMPLWLWILGLPFAVFLSYFVTSSLVHYALLPFHLKPASYYMDIPGPAALESYLSAFLAPLLSGFLWATIAPVTRIFAATWIAVIHGVPCAFCSSFDWEGPPVEIIHLQLIWMVLGCLSPILIFLWLDRSEVKNWWKNARI